VTARVARCPRCFEPAPCRRCVEAQPEQLPSWWTITAAVVAGAVIIACTWTGVLFG